jgi:hypothetical protein
MARDQSTRNAELLRGQSEAAGAHHANEALHRAEAIHRIGAYSAMKMGEFMIFLAQMSKCSLSSAAAEQRYDFIGLGGSTLESKGAGDAGSRHGSYRAAARRWCA